MVSDFFHLSILKVKIFVIVCLIFCFELSRSWFSSFNRQKGGNFKIIFPVPTLSYITLVCTTYYPIIEHWQSSKLEPISQYYNIVKWSIYSFKSPRAFSLNNLFSSSPFLYILLSRRFASLFCARSMKVSDD